MNSSTDALPRCPIAVKMQVAEEVRKAQAALAALGGASSVPKTRSQKRLVTPKPLS